MTTIVQPPTMVVHLLRLMAGSLIVLSAFAGDWRLILCALAVAGGLYRMSAVRVRADQEGVQIVNLLRTRFVRWPQVAGFAFGPGYLALVVENDPPVVIPMEATQRTQLSDSKRQASMEHFQKELLRARDT